MNNEIQGKIVKINSAVINGNSTYYFTLKSADDDEDNGDLVSIEPVPIPGLFEATIAVSPYLSMAAPGSLISITASEENETGLRTVTKFALVPRKGRDRKRFGHPC